TSQMKRKRRLFIVAAISLVATTGSLVRTREMGYAMANVEPTITQTNSNVGGSPGLLADSCGVPVQTAANQGQGGRALPVFPAGQYPVKLPAVSLSGARNDLPNPFRPGVHWGQLPEGRKWGSTAGVYAGLDGKTIWAIDRCGA